MMRSKIAGIAAAIALTFVSTAAVAAAPVAPAASKLSVSKNMRTNANVTRANKAGGGFPFLIVFVVIAAGLGLYFAVADGGDDRPTSP
jgi:hypothetical protein